MRGRSLRYLQGVSRKLVEVPRVYLLGNLPREHPNALRRCCHRGLSARCLLWHSLRAGKELRHPSAVRDPGVCKGGRLTTTGLPVRTAIESGLQAGYRVTNVASYEQVLVFGAAVGQPIAARQTPSARPVATNPANLAQACTEPVAALAPQKPLRPVARVARLVRVHSATVRCHGLRACTRLVHS